MSNSTTVATVSANRTETQPLFSDLSDVDGSGYVGPWQQISLAVNSSSAKLILSSTVFFLDPIYNITPVNLPVDLNATNEVSANVLSEPADASAPGLQWFIVQPSNFISVSDLTALNIATYTAVMKVVMLES